MTYRCGGAVKAMIVMLVAIVVVMMAEGSPLLQYDEGDCRVGYSVQVAKQPLRMSLLAYVSCSLNVTLGFFFPDLDPYKERDVVRFSCKGAIHTEVRNGEGPWTPIALPRLIPEGWNIFRVAVVNRSVTVTLVLGQDTVTLFTLPNLRKAADTIHVEVSEKRVARCSRVTPMWVVSAGDEVEVLLQPAGGNGRNQWLEVSGVGWGAAAPYVVFPFAPSSNRTSVPVNTTFSITSSLRGANAHYEVCKIAKNGDGIGNGDEMVMSGSVPINTHSQRLVVGGGRGDDDSTTTATTFVRLLLSSPQTKSTDNSVSSSVDYRIGFFVVLGLLVGLVGLVVIRDMRNGDGVLASLPKLRLTKKGRRTGTENAATEGQESVNAHGNGVCEGEGSKEVFIDLGSSSSPLLVPPAKMIPMQTNPRSSPNSRGDMNAE